MDGLGRELVVSYAGKRLDDDQETTHSKIDFLKCDANLTSVSLELDKSSIYRGRARRGVH